MTIIYRIGRWILIIVFLLANCWMVYDLSGARRRRKRERERAEQRRTK